MRRQMSTSVYSILVIQTSLPSTLICSYLILLYYTMKLLDDEVMGEQSGGCSYVFYSRSTCFILLNICCNGDYITLRLSGQISLLRLHACPWDISAGLGIGSQHSPSDWRLSHFGHMPLVFLLW